ncbi:MAG: HPr-rel-A system PqqD family peptide chaperone [Acidobacteria bacterium]|nr:HPr-rel-A system PqqD family peptide chaperone [Acidobacteriota bacterium]
MQVADSRTTWRRHATPTWVRFDDGDDWIVFNQASADIHLVAPILHRIWSLIPPEQGIAAADLIAALGRDLEIDAATATENVTRALAFLDEAGLVAPAFGGRG